MLNCMVLNGDTQAIQALVDYFEKLNSALADVRKLVQKEEMPLFVKEGNKIVRLTKEEILYIEGFGDYVKIYSLTQKPFLSQISLKRFETILDSRYFCRVHRSYIVSILHINCIEHKRIQIKNQLIPSVCLYKNKLKGGHGRTIRST